MQSEINITSLRDAPWVTHLGAIPHRAIRKLDPFDSIRRGVEPVVEGDPVVATGNCQLQMVVVPRGLDVTRRDAGLEAQGVVASQRSPDAARPLERQHSLGRFRAESGAFWRSNAWMRSLLN